MINGFSGMGLNELVGALARSRHGEPPARNVQAMPKLDTVQFSARGREMSALNQNSHARAARPVTVTSPPVSAAPSPTPAADDMSLMDRIKASFFSQTGDEGFDAAADLNADGTINHSDLAALRAQDNPQSPKEMLDSMRSNFFSRAGDDNFDAGLDLNTDGVINFADLVMLRTRMEAAVPQPMPRPVLPAGVAAPRPIVTMPVDDLDAAAGQPRVDSQSDSVPTMDTVRSAFFSQSGDDAYNAAADVDGDGHVNFADLAALKAR